VSQRQRREAEARRRRRIRGGMVAAVVALLALGGILFLPISDDDGPPPVEVSMVEYAFAPQEVTVAPGQDLAIANDGAIDHSYLVVDLAKGLELAGGDAGTLSLPDDVEPGTYRVICDLPGHVEEGMVGSLVVE
jgi:plastocyanin